MSETEPRRPVPDAARGRLPWPTMVATLGALVLLGALLSGLPQRLLDSRTVFAGARVSFVTGRAADRCPSLLPDPKATVVSWAMKGPHYDLSAPCRWSTDGLDAEAARRLGVEPVRAAEGEQLLLVAVNPLEEQYGVDELPSGQVATVLQAAVVVDGTVAPVEMRARKAVPRSRGRNDLTVVVMIGARPDATVRLRITDARRWQDLDLNTGQVDGGRDDPYVERTTSARWDATTRAVLSSGESGTISVTSTSDSLVALTGYRGQEQWAGRGRAFLRVPPPQICCLTWSGGSVRSSLPERFDDADVLSFRTADGEVARARPRGRQLDLTGRVTRGDREPVVFDVPAATTAGTIVLDLSRTGRPDAWATPPAPVELPVIFPGR